MKTMLTLTIVFLLACAGCGGNNSMSMTPAATPTFSPAPGTFSSVQNVSLSDSTPGAVIYYTLDGTVPTTSSLRYSQPIPILQTTTIRAVATASGYAMSDVATGTYMIALAP
jgi:hypothetical protein